MARKSRAPQTRTVWGDEHIVANQDAPAHRKEINGLKWRRRALNAVVFAGIPGMFFMGMAMFADSQASANGAPTSSVSVNSSGGKSEAWRAMQNWLAQTPAPLPGGEIVSWDGFEVVLPPEPEDPSVAAIEYTLETHEFTVRRGSSMWHAAVQVAVDKTVGATAMSVPSLDPIAPVTVSASSPWFGLASATATPAAQQAIAAWAEAFTSGSSDALHQIVQDRDTSRSYIPLSDVQELVSVETGLGGARMTEDGATDTENLIVRVELGLWWKDGKPKLGANDVEPDPTPIAYDLLIQHADSATPVVVAWGAPGSGDRLTPYQNAVGVVLSEPGTETTDTTGSTDSGDTDTSDSVEANETGE